MERKRRRIGEELLRKQGWGEHKLTLGLNGNGLTEALDPITSGKLSIEKRTNTGGDNWLKSTLLPYENVLMNMCVDSSVEAESTTENPKGKVIHSSRVYRKRYSLENRSILSSIASDVSKSSL